MKNNQLQIRCTDQLKKMIEYAAEKSQKSISEYVLDLVKKDLLSIDINKH